MKSETLIKMTKKLFLLCITTFIITVAAYSVLDDSADDPHDVDDETEGREGRICKYL